MDETKEAQKDSLQEAGKAPTGGDGNTPPEVYTKAQVEEILQKDRIERGRDVKALSDREATLKAQEDAIKAQQAEIDEIKRQKDEAELAEAKSDPAKMRAYQARKSREQEDTDLKAQRDALKKDRAVLERDKAEHEAEVKAARETQMEIKLWEIGEEHGVDPVRLKDGMKRLNLTTVEQAEELAKEMSGTSETKLSFTPISGVTTGARKSLSSLSPDEKLAKGFEDLNKKK
jgi:hypothetical protein